MILPFTVFAISCVTVVDAKVELAPVAIILVPVMLPATVKFPAEVILFDELKNWMSPEEADCKTKLLVLVAEICGFAPAKIMLPPVSTGIWLPLADCDGTNPATVLAFTA